MLGRDDTGRGGITTPGHSGRLRGKGAILLGSLAPPGAGSIPAPPHGLSP